MTPGTLHLHECITCCPTPSHAITAADATAPIKAMHQVPLPKEVHIIVPRYYMSLPRAKGQAITCHCQATSAAIDPWQKSNYPNFRHHMPLPKVIGCDCPKTLRWCITYRCPRPRHHMPLPHGLRSHCPNAILIMTSRHGITGTPERNKKKRKKRMPSILKWSESVKRLVNHWY